MKRFPIRPVPWKITISFAAHLLVLALLLHPRRASLAPMLLPGDAHGSHLTLTYLPGRAAPSAALAVKTAVVRRAPVTPVDRAALPIRKTETVLATTDAPSPHPNPNSTSGDDALGSGNVNIALVRTFPSPRPDLSRLPHGTAGDVIVDIVIDEQGKVVSLTTMKGLGYGVDEAVLATVRQWIFQPATKDGKPIASEQELLFHYQA